MTDKTTVTAFEARYCPGIPADCCDYGVISHDTGVEICRVWQRDNAELIASLLNAHQPAPDAVPVVPAIWPLGHGAVMVTHPEDAANGLFLFLRAVSDDCIGTAGEDAPSELWDRMYGAPTLTLSFKDVGALDRHIEMLERLRATAHPPAGSGDVERVTGAIERELSVDEAVQAAPFVLRRMKAERIARAAIAALTPPAEDASHD